MTVRREPAITLPPAELALIEHDLAARFCPPLPPDAVRRILIEVLATFDAAPIRTYLGILVEREATERLRRTIADGDVAVPTARAS